MLLIVSKIKLRFTISAGEKSRVPLGTDGLIAAMRQMYKKRGTCTGDIYPACRVVKPLNIHTGVDHLTGSNFSQFPGFAFNAGSNFGHFQTLPVMPVVISGLFRVLCLMPVVDF